MNEKYQNCVSRILVTDIIEEGVLLLLVQLFWYMVHKVFKERYAFVHLYFVRRFFIMFKEENGIIIPSEEDELRANPGVAFAREQKRKQLEEPREDQIVDWTEPHMEEHFWKDTKFPEDSPEKAIVKTITSVIGYKFCNERLLIQAFTRKSYAAEIKTFADNDALEFAGDRVIEYVMVRCLFNQYSRFCNKGDDGRLFYCDMNSGKLTQTKKRFVEGNYLAHRAEALGLDKYIRFGKVDIDNGMDKSLSPKEDLMEAIVGALALDCEWNYEILETVVEKLLDIHFDFDAYDESNPDYYDELNNWHQKKYGTMPEYNISKEGRDSYYCVLTYKTPDGIQRAESKRETRSMAKSMAASSALWYLQRNGYFFDLTGLKMVPDLSDAVNQLQILSDKKIVGKPEYSFGRSNEWECSVKVGRFGDDQQWPTKMGAKKLAAFATVISILSAGGMDVDKYDVLLDSNKCYWEDAVMFIFGNCEAGVDEKYKFIIGMSNKYDMVMATEKLRAKIPESLEIDHDDEYFETVGKCHRQIGQELCGAMNLDYDEFRAWANKGQM